MPVFDPKNTLAASELSIIVQTQKIPNALLFMGNNGTGKTEAAYEFAKAVNCKADSNRPCRTCPSCKKIHARMHPDMIHIRVPDKKKEISIAQIREMDHQLAVKPNESLWRMVLISRADKMNIQAQNALLKVLEEPPLHTFFILAAPGLPGLLTTIVSRCRQIRFKPMTQAQMARTLEQDFGADPQGAWIASQTAGSDMEKAMMFLNLSKPDRAVQSDGSKEPERAQPFDWSKRRHWILAQTVGLILSEKPTGKPLFLSERLSRNPDLIQDWLMVLRSFFRDLCTFQYSPAKIVNLDFLDGIKKIDEKITNEKIFEFMDVFYETEKRLTSNASPRLTLDRFFITLSCI